MNPALRVEPILRNPYSSGTHTLGRCRGRKHERNPYSSTGGVATRSKQTSCVRSDLHFTGASRQSKTEQNPRASHSSRIS